MQSTPTHSTRMRDANEHIYKVLLDNGSEGGDFLCECDETACFAGLRPKLFAPRHIALLGPMSPDCSGKPKPARPGGPRHIRTLRRAPGGGRVEARRPSRRWLR
jgi:hypothetical protein